MRADADQGQGVLKSVSIKPIRQIEVCFYQAHRTSHPDGIGGGTGEGDMRADADQGQGVLKSVSIKPTRNIQVCSIKPMERINHVELEGSYLRLIDGCITQV